MDKNSNELIALRSGLANFIGLIASKFGANVKEAKHYIASILLEEAFKLHKKEDGKYDPFIVKPVVRATLALLHEDVGELQQMLPKVQSAKRMGITKHIDNCKIVISFLEEKIANAK